MDTFKIKDDTRYLLATNEGPLKFVTFNYINQTYYLGYDANLASKCASKSVAKQMIENFKKASNNDIELKIVPIRVSYEVIDE